MLSAVSGCSRDAGRTAVGRRWLSRQSCLQFSVCVYECVSVCGAQTLAIDSQTSMEPLPSSIPPSPPHAISPATAMSSSFTPPHTHSPPPSSALPCIPSFLSSTPHSFSRAPSNSLMLSFPLFIFHYFYEFSRGIGSLLLHLCIAVSSQLSLCFPIYLTSPFLQFHLVLYLPLSLSDHALSAARFNHDGHSHSLSFSLFLFNITVLAPYLFFRYL